MNSPQEFAIAFGNLATNFDTNNSLETLLSKRRGASRNFGPKTSDRPIF